MASGKEAMLLLFSGLLAGACSTQCAVQIPSAEIATGVHMPLVSIGTGGLEMPAAKAIVETWLGLGGTGIDAAWIYRNQDSVREAIAAAGAPREKLFITSKIPGCVGAAASKFIDDDLRQLGVDYIDLLLIHFPRPRIACEATWKVLAEYHAKGALKAIGVSNFQAADLQALLPTTELVPAVNQIELNVLMHDVATIEYCTANKIAVEAYSPLGRSGHSGDIPDNKVIQAIAANHGVSPYQVALKWVLQHGYLLTFQSSSAAHQEMDADLFAFNLTSDEMTQLDKLQVQAPIMV